MPITTTSSATCPVWSPKAVAKLTDHRDRQVRRFIAHKCHEVGDRGLVNATLCRAATGAGRVIKLV
jgi:hypothetical protein